MIKESIMFTDPHAITREGAGVFYFRNRRLLIRWWTHACPPDDENRTCLSILFDMPISKNKQFGLGNRHVYFMILVDTRLNLCTPGLLHASTSHMDN